jgi:hypothetical protein
MNQSRRVDAENGLSAMKGCQLGRVGGLECLLQQEQVERLVLHREVEMGNGVVAGPVAFVVHCHQAGGTPVAAHTAGRHHAQAPQRRLQVVLFDQPSVAGRPLVLLDLVSA